MTSLQKIGQEIKTFGTLGSKIQLWKKNTFLEMQLKIGKGILMWTLWLHYKKMDNRWKFFALLVPKVNFEKVAFFAYEIENGQRAPNVNPLTFQKKLDTDQNFWHYWHQKSIRKKLPFLHMKLKFGKELLMWTLWLP